jgi:RND family efflux transporter MFP subunit
MNTLNHEPSLLKLPIVKSAFIIALLTGLVACSEVSTETETKIYHQLADVIEVNPETGYTIAREYIGKIVAKQQTQLSFEYSGRVNDIFVDTGEQVEEGQILASQDTELLAIRVLELNAKINQTNAQIKLNEANLKRTNTLITDGYASEQLVDELIAQQTVFAATLDGLNANLASLNYQIKKGQLVAPYQGIISERYIAQGDIVSSGMPSFKLIKQSQQEVSLGIPVEVANALNVEQELTVIIGDSRLAANIIAIGKNINTINRTVNLRLRISHTEERFNGRIANVIINQNIDSPGYWVPISALTDGIRGQWNVYQIVDTKQLGIYSIQATHVQVLHTTATQAFISSMNTKGLSIISAGLHRYVPGELIRSNHLTKKLGAQ